jgi:hypothetical protein
MGDWCTEWALSSAFGINMDPLVISGRFGEEIHAGLINFHPLAVSKMFAEMTSHIIRAVKCCNCHRNLPCECLASEVG